MSKGKRIMLAVGYAEKENGLFVITKFKKFGGGSVVLGKYDLAKCVLLLGKSNVEAAVKYLERHRK
jgi:hypothetical protein